MTAAEAAELVAVGFAGAIAGDAVAELAAFGPGAVVLFARNVGTPVELRTLTAALRATGSPPPLIAIDQEGGRVARITDGVVALPPALAFGAVGDVAAAERAGTVLGRDLARLGITVDFAPVADLAIDPDNTAIGSRAYAADAATAGAFAGAVARGLTRGGVVPTLKHFPGHGATAVDSHTALPHIRVDLATLRERELVAFAGGLAGGGDPLVMTAHVVVDALDATAPATCSSRVVTGLLRDELGFDGVVITDCLEMDAIAATRGTVVAAVDALAAGVDLVLVSHTLDLARAVTKAIVAAVAGGRLPAERVAQARRRVRALRERAARLVPTDDALDAGEPAALARRAITVVRGSARLRDGVPATVISFEGVAFDGAGGARGERPSLSAALRARRVRSDHLRVALDPVADDVDLLCAHLSALGARDVVIVVRRSRAHPAQRAAVARLLAIVPDAIVVVALEPWDAAAFDARTIVCTYDDGELMIEACADVLCGRAEAAGRLPVADAVDA